MTPKRTIHRALSVSIATALVLILAGTLAVRVTARSQTEPVTESTAVTKPSPEPAPATVPAPLPLSVDDLPTPFCWGCSWNAYHPAEFQIDLDYLAPLGDGSSNAALWIRQFAKSDGSRVAEDWGARKIEREIGGRTWRILPADDPLLLEAEPWVDQARCSFYPEVWEFTGVATAIPNLLLTIDLARSWVARGMEAEDLDLAREDYRRAIRLGRLLLQDDVTIIQDLVAMACIRMGAEALYEQARREGDSTMMVATALVLADKDAMRHLAARRTTVSEGILRGLGGDPQGGWSLEVGDEEVEALADHARKVSERRYRLEALIVLRLAHHLGTATQREAAGAVLREFSEGEDAFLADAARAALEEPLTDAELAMQVED
jgi:hypothetical protein